LKRPQVSSNPSPWGYGFLGHQLARASLSIATNHAEGNGRITKPGRRNVFIIVRGSTQARVSLLGLALRRGLLEPDRHTTLRQNLEEISRMISGLISGLDKRAA